jgi:hypothetical protein
MAIDIRIQFLEQIARVFSSVASQMLILQKEVHAQICFADDGGVLDGEVANAWENEVLECLDTNNTWARVYEQDV